MSKEILKYIFLLLLLPVLQEMIFNNINLFGYVNPTIFIVFVFIFPVYKNKTWILLFAFILGLSIDFLSNDNGINAFALVFIAYFRLTILKFIRGVSFDDVDEIDIKHLENLVMVFWIAIVTFIYSFIVFLLEQFNFHLLGQVLLKTILTSILTSLLLIFGMQLFNNKKSNVW